jgi:hypothetical protein
VKVTQDARVVRDRTGKELGWGLENAFTPRYMFTIPGSLDAQKRPAQRVFLGRSGFRDHGFHTYPLLIDPDSPATDPTKFMIPFNLEPHQVDVADDNSVYYTQQGFFLGKSAQRIFRLPLPGEKPEYSDAAVVPDGKLFLRFLDGRLNVVVHRTWIVQDVPGKPAEFTDRREWWQYDPATKVCRLLVEDLPLVQHVATSAHYGVVAIGGGSRGRVNAPLYSVMIQDPGPKYSYNPILDGPRDGARELKLRWTAEGDYPKTATGFQFLPEAGLFITGITFSNGEAFGALDAATGQAKKGHFMGDGRPVHECYPMGTNRLAARVGDNTRIRFWNTKTGKPEGELAIPELPQAQPPAANQLHLRVSPDGKYLVAARAGVAQKPVPCAFRLIDTETGTAILSFDWTGGTAHFTADSSRVLVAEYGGRFRWFKLPTGEVEGGWEFSDPDGFGAPHEIHGVSADGSVIAYLGPRKSRRDQAFYTLDGKTGDALRRFPREYPPPADRILSEDGQRVVLLRPSLPGRPTFELLPTKDGPAVGRVSVPVRANLIPNYRFAPDGKSLLVHDYGAGRLYLFELPDAPK